MNRIIKACEVLDLNIIKIQYNEFDDGPAFTKDEVKSREEARLIATELAIDGMTCASCTSAIETAIAKVPGVERIAVSLPLSKATVVHNPAVSPVDDILSAMRGVGYDAKVGERTSEQKLEIVQHAQELQKLKNAFSNAATMASIIVTIDWLSRLSYLWRYCLMFRMSSVGLGIWVQLVEASWIHEHAWGRGWRSPLTMDTLISLSLVCGLALSFFNIHLHGVVAANQYFSSGAFLTLVAIGGRYLDTLFRRQTNSSLADLHKLQSQMTMVRLRKSSARGWEITPTHSQRVPAVLLQQGDEIVVEPGSVAPCDCYVLEGTSSIDQSTMTGEPVPVMKKEGDFLMSGTRNLSKEIVAIVAREQGDSSLEQLLSSISSATEQSAEEGNGTTQLLSSYFVCIILLLALLGFGWEYTSSVADLSFAVLLNLACERAMAILASACPCALGLATPSAVMTGLSAAWTRGAILTGGLGTLQKMTSLTHIVMDKTGTLTTGLLKVSNASKFLDARALMLICAGERADALTHPIARTVFQWALLHLPDPQKREQNAIEVRDHVSKPGRGVSCKARLPSEVEWQSLHVGTASFLAESCIPISSPSRDHDQPTFTSVYIAINGIHISTLFLQDTIRAEAPAVIAHLKASNLNLTMLTGDNALEANRVSSELGIPVLASRTLPHEKKNLIHDLQSQSTHNVIAMLGDGINDTPAMAAADVGIFLSPGLLSHRATTHTTPTSLQRSSADVILTSPSLTVLPEVLLIAKKTVRQAQLNTRWAIAYNIVAVALAMGLGERWGVRVDAAMAGTMMALSSCVVMVGCLMLRRELAKIKFDNT